MSTSLRAAITALAQALKAGPVSSAEDALALAALIPALHQHLVPAAPTGAQEFMLDPRYALAMASFAESAGHQALRTQIYAAHLIEDSAAHTLTSDELDAVRAGTTDFSTPVERSAARPCFANPTALLAAWLHTGFFEAKRRIQDAHHVIGQYDYQHQSYPAQYPLMAQRFNDQTRPPGEVLAAARRMSALEPKREEFAIPTPSSVLAENGELLEAEVYRQMEEPDPGTRRKLVSSCLKEAKNRTAKKRPEAEEGIFRRGERDGLVHYDVALRPVRAELFESSIAQSDNPRSEAGQAAREASEANEEHGGEFDQVGGAHPDFVTDEEAAASHEPDRAPLSPAARRLNGMMNLMQINARRLRELLEATRNRRSASENSQPEHQEPNIPLIKPQVVVMMSLDELEGRAKTHGITSHGFKLNATDLRQALANAQIIPMVLGGKGEILDIGRSQRKHPKYMRLGVTVRDRGCLVPGCTMDPERCNIHHIWFWSEGGVTAVYWSAMLCDTHHHDVHAGLIKVIPDDGVPKVILPSFIDPTQTPVRNSYHMAKAA
ncbi:HNH endonuclease signature motif containing protein [Glutamicibacter arilaitensis]|uniref:HNH endonuclease signature motif containing protein n=1 Tax=Glutamicibacter arilaitensis TaxID=256701 RepID=UPI003F960EAB